MYAVSADIVYTKNISIPFTSQAPYGNWNEPWHNACEETSIAMVDAYYRDVRSFSKAAAKQQILDIFHIKQTYIGKSLDESANTITTLINQFLSWEAVVIDNPTLKQIHDELDAGRPIIIPVMADLLKNPHFRGTFPYHVLVISGYDESTEEFITQEPGTRYGENYRYSYQTLLDANRDFDTVDITRAPKRMIFTSPDIRQNGETDGDSDGLTKNQELHYTTSLISADTDADGYTDGIEIQTNHSPLDNEKKILKSGAVVKSSDSSTVFLYKNKTLFPFANEKAFLNLGYTWSDIAHITPLLRDLQTRGDVLY